MIIKTERLNLRRVCAKDWKSIKKIWEDQNNSIYACYDIPHDTDPLVVQKRIERWASYEDSLEHMFFAVCLEQELIGFVSFNQRNEGYEIGYGFMTEFQGKGYAKESISALINYIKEEQTGLTFYAGTAILNHPSVKLLTALGFKETGRESVSFYKDENGEDIYFEGGLYELKAYTHSCPFENQGLIHKIIYVGNKKSIIVYECDECMAFWDNPSVQNKDNAIGRALEGGDNGYFEKQGIGNIEKVIDKGANY